MNPDFDWWSCPRVSSQAFVGIIAKDNYPEGLPYQLGIAEWGVGGYKPLDEFFPSLEAALQAAKDRNRTIGLTEDEALSIKTSSMRAPGGRERRRA
jgi:hypothetical protein